MKKGRPRILVVFLHGLGDNIMATPAIRALRKKYPEAYIAIMGLKTLPVRDIWENNPYIDEYFESSFSYNPRWWNPLLFQLVDKKKIIREIKILKKEKRFDKVFVVTLQNRRLHKIDRIAKELGVKLITRNYRLFLKIPTKTAREFIKKNKIKGKIIAIHRVSSHYKRSWKFKEAERFINLIKNKDKNINFFIFNSLKSFKEEERREGRHLSGKKIYNINTFSLKSAIALFSLCDYFVGIDGFFQHIASAYKIPSIVITKRTLPQVDRNIAPNNIEIFGNGKAETILNRLKMLIK
ncbi:hypothetical protein B6U80_02125 [Candidatus Pacearchaeota archaeon ex4484_26]|nr:MAG: hypothetical protein B6U80_02125 [Candidatus Pacearchaeota archaeon ex4484_26]